MARRKSRTLTEVELEVMGVVWKSGEASVEDVRQGLEEAGRPLAFSSVRTMLGILREKGYVARRQQGRGFAYRAAVSREEARQSIVRDVVDRAFDGSALDLVAALIDKRMVNAGDLRKVRELISQHEEGPEK